ncbi:MAG: restriction endonuclease subunit S [Opitutaceae bacterium]
MEVKPGYKKSEIGVIPDDWHQTTIGNTVMKVGSGITPHGGSNVYKEQGRPFVRSQNVGWGNLRLSDLAYIDEETHSTFPATELRQGDVLLNITGASIGRSAIADGRLVGGNVNQHVCIIRTAGEKVTPHFISYLLLSDLGQRQIDSFQAGGNREGLNFGQIRSLKIPLPPTKAEQEAIAEALSDADALIESLEQLIAKKRRLKQGAMQELLTGKKRLPGFLREFSVKTVGEVCWFQEGPGVRTTQFTTSGVKLLNGTNIFRGALNLDSTSRFISQAEADGGYAHFLADAGDIVVASSGITLERFHEKVAVVKKLDLPFCMNTSTIRFKPFANVLAADYLYQFLISDDFKRQIGGQATGSAQLNFGPSHVAIIRLSLPSFSEQIAIATVLTEMDGELAALEAKLAKARDLKQGMMQSLLTGRIRLVPPASTVVAFPPPKASTSQPAKAHNRSITRR